MPDNDRGNCRGLYHNQVTKHMKTLITLLTVSALCYGAFAADGEINRTRGESAFAAREFSAGILYGGTVSDIGGRNDLAGGHGVVRGTYFLTEHLGGFVQGSLDHDGTRLVDGGGAGVLLRYPFQKLAPYVGLSADWTPYDVRNGGDYTSYNIRVGAEYRLGERLSLVVEALKDLDRFRMDSLDILAGVSLRF